MPSKNSKTSLLDEPGDIHAPPGSREWAIAVVRNIRYAVSQMDSDAESAGRWLKLAKEKGAPKALGYVSFELLLAKECQLNSEVADALIQSKSGRTVGEAILDVQARAKEAVPLKEHGRPKRNSDIKISNDGDVAKTQATALMEETEILRDQMPDGDPATETKVGVPTFNGKRNADYLTARIARDHPEILERMKQGQFKSVRAAAKEAGIVKDPTPLQLLWRAWNKASDDDRREFSARTTQYLDDDSGKDAK
jgi:hypothetical protein